LISPPRLLVRFVSIRFSVHPVRGCASLFWFASCRFRDYLHLVATSRSIRWLGVLERRPTPSVRFCSPGACWQCDRHVFCSVASLLSLRWNRQLGCFFLCRPCALTMFTPQLARAKRNGLSIRCCEPLCDDSSRNGRRNATEAMSFGQRDIQSWPIWEHYRCADMRPCIRSEDIGRLAAATAVPLLPLATVFSLEVGDADR